MNSTEIDFDKISQNDIYNCREWEVISLDSGYNLGTFQTRYEAEKCADKHDNSVVYSWILDLR